MVQTRSKTKKAQLRIAKKLGTLSDTQAAPAKEPSTVSSGKSAKNNVSIKKTSKRAKTREGTASGLPIGKRGSLAMLLELNLDVLSLILSYLHPMDLLNLARLTKPLRQFLMSKSHAFIWVAARRTLLVELPECPPDLSEPQYAHLAFYSHCHSRDQGAVDTIYWNIRRRYCTDCRDERLVELDQCTSLPNDGMLPLEYWQTTRGRSTRTSEYFVDVEQCEAVCEEYLPISPANQRKFITQRCKATNAIMKHAWQCQLWSQAAAAAREQELDDVKNARTNSILARLKDAGYEREVEYWGRDAIVQSRPGLFRSAKPLSEEDWKGLYSKLEPHIIELREKRIDLVVRKPRQKVLIDLYDRYIKGPAPEGGAVDVLPTVSDVAQFEPFDAILELPEDETVDETMFGSAFDQLPALTRQWREQIEAELAALVDSDSDTPPKERLKLACAIFEATPVHPDDWQHVSNVVGQPWSITHVKLLSGAPADVVRACGLDPRSATVADMDRWNARLICDVCHRDRFDGRQLVFDWKSAAGTDHNDHDNDHLTPKWVRLDQELVPMVEAAEKDEQSRTPKDPKCWVYCAMCQRRALQPRYAIYLDKPSGPVYDSDVQRVTLVTHLRDVHGVQGVSADHELKENFHYVVSQDGVVDRCRGLPLVMRKMEHRVWFRSY